MLGVDSLMLDLFRNLTFPRPSIILITSFLIIFLSCTRVEKQPETVPSFVEFSDITESSGINFRHTNGASGRYFFLETVASGGGFIDYDGDDDLDIYLLNGTSIPGYISEKSLSSVLYRNDGNGKFTDVTSLVGVGNIGNYGMGMAVADYDNDGDDDLFVTNYGRNVLYRNEGGGYFSDVTTQAKLEVKNSPLFSTSAAFLDYNSDGYLDLYVCVYVDFSFDTNKKCSRDGIQSYCGPDIYDGMPDLLYRNNGDGTFSDVSIDAGIANPNGKGLGVVSGDFDKDGWPDIFVANDLTPDFLYRNNGDGTFTDRALWGGVAYGEDGVARAGMGVDSGDYDRNGYPDIYVTNFSLEPNSLHKNNGNGTFTETTFAAGLGNPTLLFLGFGTSFQDFDQDGWLDLFAANGHVIDNIALFDPTINYAQTNQVFWNQRDGRFKDISSKAGAPFQIERVHRGAAFGDIDNDGDIDVLVTAVNDSPLLLRNEGLGVNGQGSNNSLLVSTEGTDSNRNGIGAQVIVVAENGRQSREVRSGYSYLAANDLRVHFGLGPSSIIDSVIVKWPTGLEDVATEIEPNRWITFREDEGVVSQKRFHHR